jgi:hypothetical protein
MVGIFPDSTLSSHVLLVPEHWIATVIARHDRVVGLMVRQLLEYMFIDHRSLAYKLWSAVGQVRLRDHRDTIVGVRGLHRHGEVFLPVRHVQLLLEHRKIGPRHWQLRLELVRRVWLLEDRVPSVRGVNRHWNGKLLISSSTSTRLVLAA